MALFFSGGERKELKLRVTGRIWKEPPNLDAPPAGSCVPNLSLYLDLVSVPPKLLKKGLEGRRNPNPLALWTQLTCEIVENP
ncbi:hypothetical protein OSB04_010748 [Centaurea solstitialis]|uniref:Uncharacterized protein n=1 Tax=Centaurea solstitialis TaxID=347529 RepID=A0AA38T9V3_9ASTR|nr:hypothetical protein OSB04_010748 [Centaurea solstitialis]